MSKIKQLLSGLTPSVVVAVTVAALAALAAFRITLTATEQASVVVFAGAAALILLKYRTVESVIGLVTAGVGVAVAFGLPVTDAQRESILTLAGLLAGGLLGKGVVTAVKARKQAARGPAAQEPKTSGAEVVVTVTGDASDLHDTLDEVEQRLGWIDHHAKQVADALHGVIHSGRSLFATYATGRRPPKNAPAIRLTNILTGVVPAHPVTADHFGKLPFGLYGNDKYGVCGPTSVANLVRLVTAGLLGVEIVPSQEDVFDLYRRSGNPSFNPVTGAGDNGVDMQTMLEALLAGGIGDGKGGKIKPLAFAKVNVASDTELEAAVSIFGGVLWGVNLETAQQAQTNAAPPKWDYRRSGEWGGHAVLDGAYEAGQLEDVISWAIRVETTAGFRANQLEEAWVVVWPWNLEHPAFQAGVDVPALAAAYKALTGKDLPVPAPTPVPTPGTGPASPADVALWEGVKAWAQSRHGSTTRPVAAQLTAWAKRIGLS